MTKIMDNAKVISQEMLTKDIYSLWISTAMAAGSKPGQFVNVYIDDASKLLPRPISICEADRERGALRLVYRVTGEHTGTKVLSRLESGDTLRVLGALGNGFPLDSKSTILIGGGIGIPPMLECAKAIEGEKLIVLGFRDSSTFLTEDFERYGRVYVATEDGSVGMKGNVLDVIKANSLSADRILACGPTPMLRAIKQHAGEAEISCYLSLEERIVCGVGACLACTCKTTEADEHSQVRNKRVCADGPVFEAFEVEL